MYGIYLIFLLSFSFLSKWVFLKWGTTKWSFSRRKRLWLYASFFMHTVTVSGFINLDRTFADRILQSLKISLYICQHKPRPTASSDPVWPSRDSWKHGAMSPGKRIRGCLRCPSSAFPGFSLEPGMGDHTISCNCYPAKVELLLAVSRRERILTL